MSAKLRIRLVVLVALIGVFIWQRSRRLGELQRGREPAVAVPTAQQPASQQTTNVVLVGPPKTLHLESPQAALATQIGMLQTNDYDAFAKTFMIAVSRAQFEACRARMDGVRISPDWEMAKEERRNGHRVLRVSIWGKSYTDFHFIDGKVMTAQLWCLPLVP